MLRELDPKTENVIELAKQEARSRGLKQVSTEHLLIAILLQGNNRTTMVFEAWGITLDILKQEVYRLSGKPPVDLKAEQRAQSMARLMKRNQTVIPKKEVHFEMYMTPRAKASLLQAMIECRELFHEIVTPDHLCLGILKLPEVHIAALAVTNLGAGLLPVYNQIKELLDTRAQLQ